MLVKTYPKLCFSLKNQKGVAVVEMLPLLAVFIILFGLIFGFWTSVHRGILQSISARHYAFEVINNRANFMYHRDTMKADSEKHYYKRNGYRFFAVVEKQLTSNPGFWPQERDLSLFNQDPMSIPPNRTSNKANPIWIKTGYGICIDFECGGRP